MLAVGVYRVLRHHAKYQQIALPADYDARRRRERVNHYIIYGSLQGLTLGLFCFVGHLLGAR